ncbi:hypothetical protein ACN4EG_26715, partial [Alkalinema pantanalense CENA528]|uniref:hypothetical protein n=1 Tax=Alkalinema pantanalense TaxID=1620705 RepID=UPI003D6FB3FB
MDRSIQTGWIPDRQDPRDFTLNNQLIQQLLIHSQSDRRVTQVTQELISWLNELISYLPSGLSVFNLWIEALQSNPSIGSSKLPIYCLLQLITFSVPSLG